MTIVLQAQTRSNIYETLCHQHLFDLKDGQINKLHSITQLFFLEIIIPLRLLTVMIL